MSQYITYYHTMFESGGGGGGGGSKNTVGVERDSKLQKKTILKLIVS